jgi:hypothetical protein
MTIYETTSATTTTAMGCATMCEFLLHLVVNHWCVSSSDMVHSGSIPTNKKYGKQNKN